MEGPNSHTCFTDLENKVAVFLLMVGESIIYCSAVKNF